MAAGPRGAFGGREPDPDAIGTAAVLGLFGFEALGDLPACGYN